MASRISRDAQANLGARFYGFIGGDCQGMSLRVVSLPSRRPHSEGQSLLMTGMMVQALLERQVNTGDRLGLRRPEPHLRPARRLHKRPGCGRLRRRNRHGPEYRAD